MIYNNRLSPSNASKLEPREMLVSAESDFSDNSIDPFVLKYPNSPQVVQVFGGRVKSNWSEENYNPDNDSDHSDLNSTMLKSEFQTEDDWFRGDSDIWMGFDLELGPDYLKDHDNTTAGLMQLWSFTNDDKSGAAGPSGILRYDARDGGQLVYHTLNLNTSERVYYQVLDDVERGEKYDITIHAKPGFGDGVLEIWVDGEKTVSDYSADFGVGNIDDGEQQGFSTFNLGQYNFQHEDGFSDSWDVTNHAYDGFIDGETRTVYYDDVTWLSDATGTAAYRAVNPA